MTSRERLLTAFAHRQPDIVPIAPDIDLIGMRWWDEKADKPWWNVYLYGDPPLRNVYVEANRRLGCDIWDYFHGLQEDADVHPTRKILQKKEEGILVEYVTRTPYGDLREVVEFPRDNPPWTRERLIKDIPSDWPKLRWVMEQRSWLPKLSPEDDLGDSGVAEVTVDLFPDFWCSVRGSERMLLDFYDFPEIMEEIFEFYLEYAIRRTEACIRARPDAILIQGSSSSMSLISPGIYRRYCLPIVKQVTRMCKRAGILSHQHTCGRSREVVEVNYDETDLDVMEPLEGNPTGNVDLREVKEKFGGKLCLKGNINTVTLLKGTPEDVEREVRKAIEGAAKGGGFVLSTGDSPGRDTPDANIYRMVETGRKYGKY